MIKLPTKIYNELIQMIKGPIIEDLTNIALVIFYLDSVKAKDAAEWVRNNTMVYRQGLLEGFCVDNTPEQQLKDLHEKDKPEVRDLRDIYAK